MVDFNYIMDVTPRKRANIIAPKKHTGLSIRNIFEMLAIPKSTVGDIIKRAKDTDITTWKIWKKVQDNTAKCQGNDKK